jgi:hypothetical protein
VLAFIAHVAAELRRPQHRLPDDPQNPTFTAERYRKMHPHTYRLAIQWACVDGLPVTVVASALGASRNLISQIVLRESEATGIEQQKRRAGMEYAHLARLGRESLARIILSFGDEGVIEHMPADKRTALLKALSVVPAIATDKSELLLGGATSRVEVSAASPDHDRLMEYLDRLRSTGLGGVSADKLGPAAGAQGGAAGELGAGSARAWLPAVGPVVEGELVEAAPAGPAAHGQCTAEAQIAEDSRA